MEAAWGDAGLIERLADIQYRMLDRARDRGAFEVARQPGAAPNFEPLRGARQCLIVTFKRSGEPVPTPVNFGLSEGGKLYFRSEPRSAKVRRLRRDPHVRVCACSFRGKPVGPLAEGRARLVPATEHEQATSALARNWSPAMRLLERGLDRLPVQMVYVEVAPAAAGGTAQEAA